MPAYYNEVDDKAAAWLRELIRRNLIAPGDVDTRSIIDVEPADLIGYDQCHFFAGIGVWSYAGRLAGWPDERPLWTGSCPCQPFSAAGQGGGFDDERHLWPAFHHLIAERRPAVVFGEQVASKDGFAWLDLVQADLEGEDYAFGAIDFCAASVGAPHIRQRLYWVGERLEHAEGDRRPERRAEPGQWSAVGGRRDGGLADDDNEGLALRSIADDRRGIVRHQGSPAAAGGIHGGVADTARQQHDGSGDRGPRRRAEYPAGGTDGGVADDDGERQPERSQPDGGALEPGQQAPRRADAGGCGDAGGPGPVNGFWRDADWLFCRDGKWRPARPGSFPLVTGAPCRVGRLRGYGNALNAEAATVFIQSYLDTCEG